MTKRREIIIYKNNTKVITKNQNQRKILNKVETVKVL